jgi:NitT/TauT family transport system ATP-binding protein
MLRALDDAAPRVDVFVANAAATAFRPLLESKPHHVEKTYAITIGAFLQIVQHLAPRMREGGRIVAMSGMDTHRYVAGHGVLASAKAALEALTRYLAVELGPNGITVNAVNPGYVDTDSVTLYLKDAQGRREFLDEIEGSTPLRALGSTGRGREPRVVALLARGRLDAGPGALSSTAASSSTRPATACAGGRRRGGCPRSGDRRRSGRRVRRLRERHEGARRRVRWRSAHAEIVSVVGPSGCGKSTLVRLLAGLLEPAPGRVQAPRDGIGIVFQQPTLLPWRTVTANVALPLELAGTRPGEATASALATLARVGLADFARVYPSELSGGMRMRAALARALVTGPRVLLLDEPFASLDELARERLAEELLALRSLETFAALLVTHSVAEAVFLGDRVLVMSARPGAHRRRSRRALRTDANRRASQRARIRACHRRVSRCLRRAA